MVPIERLSMQASANTEGAAAVPRWPTNLAGAHNSSLLTGSLLSATLPFEFRAAMCFFSHRNGRNLLM